MPDYYQQTSFEIPLTATGAKWFAEQLKEIEVDAATAERINLCPGDKVPAWVLRALESGDLTDPYTGLEVVVERDPEGKRTVAWFGAEEFFNADAVEYLVREYLKACDPGGYVWGLFANGCSRPVVGAFSGGYFIITPDKETTVWQSAEAAVESKLRELADLGVLDLREEDREVCREDKRLLVQFRIGYMSPFGANGGYKSIEQLWADHPGADMEEFLFEIPEQCREFAADIARGRAFSAGWSSDNTLSDVRVTG